MSKRIFPAFVYTRNFAAGVLLVMLWLSFKMLDVFPRPRDATFLAVFMPLILGCVWMFLQLVRSGEFLADPSPTQAPATPRPWAYAYLVIHIDITQSPPVATFACIYSASAQDLTRFGKETKAELYRVGAKTFSEAYDEMEQIVPLYFPWVVPLMTRNR